jgi:hypothetical protein
MNGRYGRPWPSRSRHAPWSTGSPDASARSIAAATSRDLPIPASPRTRTSIGSRPPPGPGAVDHGQLFVPADDDRARARPHAGDGTTVASRKRAVRRRRGRRSRLSVHAGATLRRRRLAGPGRGAARSAASGSAVGAVGIAPSAAARPSSASAATQRPARAWTRTAAGRTRRFAAGSGGGRKRRSRSGAEKVGEGFHRFVSASPEPSPVPEASRLRDRLPSGGSPMPTP